MVVLLLSLILIALLFGRRAVFALVGLAAGVVGGLIAVGIAIVLGVLAYAYLAKEPPSQTSTPPAQQQQVPVQSQPRRQQDPPQRTSLAATSPSRAPSACSSWSKNAEPRPSGYVHIVQASDRLPHLAAFYCVPESVLRDANAALFAYNESQTGHRMIINEPIILPAGVTIPTGAAWARLANALDKPAPATVAVNAN